MYRFAMQHRSLNNCTRKIIKVIGRMSRWTKIRRSKQTGTWNKGKQTSMGLKVYFHEEHIWTYLLTTVQISQSAVKMLNNGIKLFTKMEGEIYWYYFETSKEYDWWYLWDSLQSMVCPFNTLNELKHIKTGWILLVRNLKPITWLN
jgi:hypothetical protein